MAFNGSGVYNRIRNWVQDKANSIPVTASRMDEEDDSIATALSTAICRDGQSTTTARIPFASGVSAAAGSTSAAAYGQTNDADTGIYFPATDQVGITAGGTGTVVVTATGISITGTLTPSGQLLAASGTVAAPGHSFSADPDCGAYRIGANNIGYAVNGAKVLDIGTAGLGVTGTLTATGAATLSSSLALTGDLAINTNKFTVTAASGNTSVAGTLAVTGNATLSGTLGVTGDFAVATNKLTVAAASGNTAVAGTLAVTGASTLTGALTANNAAGIAGRNVAKAQVSFTVSNLGVITVNTSSSFNIASVASQTVNSQNGFRVTFTSALPSANYIVSHTAGAELSSTQLCGITSRAADRTTTTFDFVFLNASVGVQIINLNCSITFFDAA